MVISFPKEYSTNIIDNLETLAPTKEIKQDYQSIRTNILPQIKDYPEISEINIKKKQLHNTNTLVKPTVLSENFSSLPKPNNSASSNSNQSSNTTYSNNIEDKWKDSCVCNKASITCGWDDYVVCKTKDSICTPQCIRGF